MSPGKETGAGAASSAMSSGHGDACLTLYSGDRYVTFEVGWWDGMCWVVPGLGL